MRSVLPSSPDMLLWMNCIPFAHQCVSFRSVMLMLPSLSPLPTGICHLLPYPLVGPVLFSHPDSLQISHLPAHLFLVLLCPYKVFLRQLPARFLPAASCPLPACSPTAGLLWLELLRCYTSCFSGNLETLLPSALCFLAPVGQPFKAPPGPPTLSLSTTAACVSSLLNRSDSCINLYFTYLQNTLFWEYVHVVFVSVTLASPARAVTRPVTSCKFLLSCLWNVCVYESSLRVRLSVSKHREGGLSRC